MGMFDTVWVNCPKCGDELSFQSKSGDCVLANYKLENAPKDVMYNVNRHSPIKCECGRKYKIDIDKRELVEVL